MMSINKVILKKVAITLVVIGAIISTIFLLVDYRSPKVCYVDNYELFDQFHGKKELEQRLNTLENKHKATLDSMKIELMALKGNSSIDPQIIKNKEQVFYQVNQSFLEQYQDQSQEFTSQIWKQINEYVQEFGEAYHYDFIYGLQGDGNLMYGNDQMDQTNKILTYINKKYDGV